MLFAICFCVAFAIENKILKLSKNIIKFADTNKQVIFYFANKKYARILITNNLYLSIFNPIECLAYQAFTS